MLQKNLSKVKRQHTKCEKIFTNHILVRLLITRTYKENSYNLPTKGQINPINPIKNEKIFE